MEFSPLARVDCSEAKETENADMLSGPLAAAAEEDEYPPVKSILTPADDMFSVDPARQEVFTAFPDIAPDSAANASDRDPASTTVREVGKQDAAGELQANDA